MAASSINASTFTLSSAAGAVTGTVTASGTSATFTPSAPLAAGTQYTATVTTGVKDLSGLPLAAPYRWSFTVAAAAGGSGEDSDGDGVEDDEDAYPHDNRHATPGSPRRHGRIHVDVSTVFGAYLTETRAFGENLGGIVQAGRPEGYHFEDGLVSFRINGGTVTGRGEMRITYPSVVPAGSRVYVVTPSGFQEVAGAKISGDTVTVPVGSESSAVKGLLVGGSGAAPASIVGVASPDAAPSPSAGGGCSASGGNGGSWEPFALLAFALLLRGRFTRRRG
jgi:MYXO-CTERM domain-containing protein